MKTVKPADTIETPEQAVAPEAVITPDSEPRPPDGPVESILPVPDVPTTTPPAVIEVITAPAPEPVHDEELVVTSRPATFRRAGRAFSHEPVRLRASEMTADEYQLITQEPMLEVSITPVAKES